MFSFITSIVFFYVTYEIGMTLGLTPGDFTDLHGFTWRGELISEITLEEEQIHQSCINTSVPTYNGEKIPPRCLENKYFLKRWIKKRFEMH